MRHKRRRKKGKEKEGVHWPPVWHQELWKRLENQVSVIPPTGSTAVFSASQVGKLRLGDVKRLLYSQYLADQQLQPQNVRL